MENYAGSQPASPPLRSQETNFPKKLSKTKSAPFGSAAFVPLRAGQAVAFRGRAGPLRAALRRGRSARGFPAAAPGSPGLPQPPKRPGGSLPHPASPGPADPAPPPRLSPPLKFNGGNGIFSGRLLRDTSRGAWGTRGCGSSRPPSAPSPSRPGAAPGDGGQRQRLQKLGMKKLKA